ncbi:hypothetical protein DID88_005436 [Monilinia fructigena]|uniref:Uncharacterized protein n=1 Tax=Monilinia fructigena TaxID=38457 RepID=A0A395J031_9HELO|nr:hypothetical protein DID88_005436 [Monilinia fructigena]
MVNVTPEKSSARNILENSQKLVDEIDIPQPIISAFEGLILKPRRMCFRKRNRQSKCCNVRETARGRPQRIGEVATKDIEEVIEGGHVAALIMLLSSEHLSVRKEALTNISKVRAKLKESPLKKRTGLASPL